MFCCPVGWVTWCYIIQLGESWVNLSNQMIGITMHSSSNGRARNSLVRQQWCHPALSYRVCHVILYYPIGWTHSIPLISDSVFQIYRFFVGETASLHVHGYDRCGCSPGRPTAHVVLLTGTGNWRIWSLIVCPALSVPAHPTSIIANRVNLVFCPNLVVYEKYSS